MSYVDGETGGGRKALTGGVVMLLQAGIAAAVISGLAVTLDPPKPPPHMKTQIFPTEPLPPPPEPPKPQPDPARRISHVDTARPLVPRPEASPFPLTPPIQEIQTGADDFGKLIFIPRATPDPAPRFTPRAARPSNDVARWVTNDDYPGADIRAGNTGTVRFRLALDDAGRVTGCSIIASSGHPGLDAATCRNVSKRARFDPATDDAGTRVAGSYLGSIRWVIPED